MVATSARLLGLAIVLSYGYLQAQALSVLSEVKGIATSGVKSSSGDASSSDSSGGVSFWQPSVGEPWQIVLSSAINIPDSSTTTTPNVDIFEIDMFGNSYTTITKLHDLGKRVIFYFSAGTYEDDRPDSSTFMESDLGKNLTAYPTEVWLKTNSTNVRSIMASRIQLTANKGCDAVDPDNMDGYGNDNGLGLTQNDAVDYMTFLSAEAQEYNMSISLKNAPDIIANVSAMVQFSVMESCVAYSECSFYDSFIQAGKPIFRIEYPDGGPNLVAATLAQSCSTSGEAAGSANFSTVMKKSSLDGWVGYCDGSTASTPTS